MIGNIKNIIVIQSLKEEEVKTGEDIYNDCIKRRIELIQTDENKMSHRFWDVNTEYDFVEMLEFYVVNSEYMKGGILFHFEIHGEDEKRGIILSDGSFFPWSTLISYFRKINVKCCNSLFVSMATCYGRYLYRGILPNNKAPFSGFISASQNVSTEEIIETFHILFEKLIECGNLIFAYEAIEKVKATFYYKDLEAIFEESFEISVRELKSDEKFLKYELENAKRIASEIGCTEPSELDEEFILDMVIHDLYRARKKDFYFDCDKL